MISNADLAPTILAAVGTSFDNPVDGRNILELYTNPDVKWRDYLYAETFGHHVPHRVYVWSDRRVKYVQNKDQIEELYNLELDPYELVNLALKEDHQDQLAQMRDSLEQFKKKIEFHKRGG